MLNIWGVISIVLFYVLILAVGIWAGRKGSGEESEEEVMLAGRNIGMFVGIFTMTATWVGGGYINGTAEAIYTTGLVWCQAPFGYSLSLVMGGIFFANEMRRQGYVTMLDPLQDAFGERMGGLLFVPALCGEVFWAAGILAALGATLSVIIDMDRNTSVILSACIAVFYTLFGGLYSVAYTDVIQLICILVGLWLCIPFALTNEAAGSLTEALKDPSIDWIGELKREEYGQWIDYALLLVFGGIPWQVYFQRVLSSRTALGAQILSYVAGVGCFLMAVPPVLIGAIAKVSDWNKTAYGEMYGMDPAARGESNMVLPLVMHHLTPDVVSFFGLGAVSAAVMSSADSSVLSASSMFARNVYRLIFRLKASEIEIIWVMRISIFVVGALATVMALTIPSIYGLWTMCSDLVYVILFPQLLMVVHFRHYCNTYGSLASYCMALFFRLGGGEELLQLKAFIHFPYYEPGNDELGIWEKQRFPFRTFCMLMSLGTLAAVSKLTDWLFHSGILHPKYDYFHCVVNIPEDRLKVEEPHEGEMTVMTAAMVAKYCAMEEMNGRINPAMSDSDEDSNGKTAASAKPPGAPLVGQVIERPGAVPASVQQQAKSSMSMSSPAKVIPAILRAGSITEGPSLRSGSISGPPPGSKRLFNESDDDGGSRGGGGRSGGKSYQTAL
ncbi:unnamed protein product [Orchesella dallaii]|uniref:High-affinity choline transporter 1 n=1 Tax=Orchesella dallaii TaxID=48710 RepID=A0ABP1QXG6_9HEXA